MLLKRILHKTVLYMELMRLHQPTGIWLLLWPCCWSIAMASNKPSPEFYLFALFAIGATTIRGAGCVINDIIDRKIDAQVARTKTRPLASGKLSVINALWLLLTLLVSGLIVLSELNWLAIGLSLLFFIPVIIYPYMKRIMSWPQIFLAFTFNSGAIIGWAATTGNVDIPPLFIYAAGIFWTLGYDTIYAHQDKKYDKEIGVKSSAISMGNNSKIFISIFYLLMILFLMLAGSMIFTYHNLVYYFSLLIALGHLLWQIVSVDLNDPDDCMAKFRSNMIFGWIVFFGIMIEKYLSY